MSQSCSAKLTFVLLCSGKGADYQSYRPKLQESQWCMRRDALVRCTCASLYGRNHATETDDELFLLYDEDFSMIRMNRMSKGMSANLENVQPPTEENVISAWRKASKLTESTIGRSTESFSRSSSIKIKGCDLEVECLRNSRQNEDSNRETPKIELFEYHDLNIDNMSKRALLDVIQSKCADNMEFLRKHHLNSSPSVVLRKTNHNKLVKIYNEWKATENKKDPSNVMDASLLKERSKKSLEFTFRSILSNERRRDTTKTIVMVLHEDCELGLECFKTYVREKLKSRIMNEYDCSLCDRVVVVLGAVRDMKDDEYEALHAACSALDIPMTGCHLGRTPEFTSKIVTTIVHHHHTMNILVPSLKSLLDKQNSKGRFNGPLSFLFGEKEADELRALSTFLTPYPSSTKLHVFCVVPILSSDVTTDLHKRSYILWSIVRICVCTLWRSRLASKSNNGTEEVKEDILLDTQINPLTNSLTLCFLDGMILTIDQSTLVQFLASKHQAAPSEYQILSALCEMLNPTNICRNNQLNNVEDKWKYSIEKILESTLNNSGSSDLFTCALDFDQSLFAVNDDTKHSINSVLNAAYGLPNDYSETQYQQRDSDKSNKMKKKQQVVFSLYQLGREEKMKDGQTKKSMKRIYKAITKCFKKRSIPMIRQCWYKDSTDATAVGITILQHLHYHNRLIPALQSIVIQEKLLGKKTSSKRKQKKPRKDSIKKAKM